MGSSGVVKNRKRQIPIFAARVCLRNGGAQREVEYSTDREREVCHKTIKRIFRISKKD